ncbi:RNA polymerase sigma factor (sigma-70 family) [Nitrobacteraceae bacterium AZCC 1564]
MSIAASSLPTQTVDLDVLFRQYHAELSAFAYRRVKNRETAADVVQDAFVRYLDCGLSAIAQHTHPRFFLWRIVGNITIDIARRDRRRGAFTSIDDVAEQVVDPLPTPYERLETRQQFMLLKKALNDLPPAQSTALVLNRLEGLSHADIAKRLGVSSSMVSKYIMSALKHCLRRMTLSGF